LRQVDNPDDIKMLEVDRSSLLGQAKMKTRMGLALAVMMAMTLGHVKTIRIE